MSDSVAIDAAELAADVDFTSMLQRVSFQPGILLGAAALTTEQAYHVRRLNRHQRWLIGPGTVFGLRVDVAPSATDPADVLITVSPGYGIDGLGREIMVSQTYAISLRDWLAAATANSQPLAPYVGGVLYLRVTARAQACPNALQPVVAALFDAGLDPVVTAQIGDSFLLEISCDANQTGDTAAAPLAAWSPDHVTPTAAQLATVTTGTGATPAETGLLTARERAMLAAVTDPTESNTLTLQAWLLGRPIAPPDTSPGAQAGYEEAARLLLASVHATLATISAAPSVADTSVNNLVRPFIRPNALLTALKLP
jgi:hypothetical protein